MHRSILIRHLLIRLLYWNDPLTPMEAQVNILEDIYSASVRDHLHPNGVKKMELKKWKTELKKMQASGFYLKYSEV